MNTELLISEIMQRPAIWMSRHSHHKMRNDIKQLWIEIKQYFPGREIDDLKKKWKNLKDNYRKELKKYPISLSGEPGSDLKSQWKYFEQLEFLKDEFMLTQGDKTLALEPQIKDENETIPLSEEESTQPQSLADPLSPSSPQTSTSTQSSETTYLQTKTPNRNRKRPNQLRAEYLEIEKKKLKLLELEVAKSATNNEEKKSDDYYFLMSLLPQMEKLNVMQKMRLRNKFNQALMDEIALNENHYRY